MGNRNNDNTRFRSTLLWTGMNVTVKALWYIESHLGSDLSLEARRVWGFPDTICRVHLAPVQVMGSHSTSVVNELSKAAKALVDGAPDILSVALDARYGSHEAFTRAFKQHFGVTPEQARAQRITNLKLQEPTKMPNIAAAHIAPARIDKRDAMLVFGLSQHYTPKTMSEIPSQWEQFLHHFGHIPSQADKIAYGVIHNADDAGNSITSRH